jgi:cytochrome c553
MHQRCGAGMSAASAGLRGTQRRNLKPHFDMTHPPRHRHSHHRAGMAAALLGAAGLSWAAVAEPVDSPVSSPLLPACQACHGRDGISESADIPNLAGQKKNYLINQLDAFKRGERKNELMAAIAAQLSDADVQTLATFWSRLPGAIAGAVHVPSVAAIAPRMTFPVDFPKGFSLYETIDALDEGRVVRRYANSAALQAAREGKPLPNGAIIVVANHAVQLDAQRKPAPDANGRAIAAEVLSYAAMESRGGWGASVPALLRNGDWDYALFGPDRLRTAGLNQAACLACHQPLAASSHVFTIERLRELAMQSSPAMTR